ncbi:MAG: TIGR02757 family protein [Treponema sp.]|nr:TIGR02757 family protein [Treponema sp.]
MTDKHLSEKLEYWYKKICTKEFITDDPVQFPHRYAKHEDIEIAAFLAATIAWGKRCIILRSAEKMFSLMGNSPYDYVMSDSWKKLKTGNIHRTFFENDLKYFCRGFKHLYTKHENLENLFKSAAHESIWTGFYVFREEMAAANKGQYSRHIGYAGKDNENGSACKKLNLALRWLVRKGPVDLRLWKNIKPSALYIPLDVHVARTARKLGLLERKSNDKKTVCELTQKLRLYDSSDPAKYDFALFGMGVNGIITPS